MENNISIKVVHDMWNTQINRASKMFDGFTDEQLAHQIAPNRNSGVYLLGHLTAVHDAMLPLLGLGQKQHPELEEIFLKNPDKSNLQKPSTKQLREYWNQVNTLLNSKLAALTEAQWLEKHTAVSEEDFKKEPHRNRLNVVFGRAGHIAYHAGQLALLN